MEQTCHKLLFCREGRRKSKSGKQSKYADINSSGLRSIVERTVSKQINRNPSYSEWDEEHGPSISMQVHFQIMTRHVCSLRLTEEQATCDSPDKTGA